MKRRGDSTVRPYRATGWRMRQSALRPRADDHALIEQVLIITKDIASRDDQDLATMMAVLRAEVANGRDVLHVPVLTTCMALTFEAIRRAIGLRYYDVQLLAGLALSTGAISEMKTGEGKTIVAALPAALRALEGKGVHVATVNSYLAKRDYELLAPAYQLLGLTSALLVDGAPTPEKRAAYDADITYGTGYEYGFDYLRDELANRALPRPRLGDRFRAQLHGALDAPRSTMQRRLAFAIIDEIDSVLLDEANTPLIISTASESPDVTSEVLRRAAETSRQLRGGVHYLLRPRERTVVITEAGRTAIFGPTAKVPVVGLVRPWLTYVEQALRADHFMRRDVDYIVRDDAIQLVDQYTGRIFTDRTWQDGLHQAVEFKEGVKISAEKLAAARISRQRFYGLYRRICGMTGTAQGHESEFQEFYRLPVVVIPERVPCQRKHWSTRYFRCQFDKFQAIVEQAANLSARGRPILIGTRTIQESETLAGMLAARNVRHCVLNGVQDADEAALIARAGQASAVTVATNMAGRGTDICLSEHAKKSGGLHVIATQRQESLRVDRQLMGRAARQGDPGSCQFFVAADDEIIQQYQPGAGQAILRRLASRPRLERPDTEHPADEYLDAIMNRLQLAAERRKYRQRCDLQQHDRWLNEVVTTVAERSAG